MAIFCYPTIDLKKTGERLKKARISNKLTADKVCHNMGIQRLATVYDWERGQTLPSIDNLFALSRLYGISIDSILIATEDAVPFIYGMKVYSLMIRFVKIKT